MNISYACSIPGCMINKVLVLSLPLIMKFMNSQMNCANLCLEMSIVDTDEEDGLIRW